MKNQYEKSEKEMLRNEYSKCSIVKIQPVQILQTKSYTRKKGSFVKRNEITGEIHAKLVTA